MSHFVKRPTAEAQRRAVSYKHAMTDCPPDLFLDLDQSTAWIEAGEGWLGAGVVPANAITVVGHLLCALNIGAPQSPLDGLPARVWLYTDPQAPCPLTHGGPGTASDVATVRVTVGGTYWCQLVYQFSHELGHVVSNSWGKQWHSGAAHEWLEEACCGALSLLALERMAGRWADHGLLGDVAYAQSFRKYLAERFREFTQSGPLDPAHLQTWRIGNASALAAGKSLNDVNKPLAALLYGMMRDRTVLWHDMRALNHWPRPAELTLGDHLATWGEWCTRLGTAGELPHWLRRHLCPR